MANDSPAAKWSAYAQTILEFCDAPSARVDLRRPLSDADRRAIAEAAPARTFAVLTAENPAGRNPEDEPSPARADAMEERNERRTSKLEADLASHAVAFRRVDGVAPTGDYREHCLAVALPRKDATALARRFDQLALFWYDGRDFWLMPAEADAEPERLPRAN